MKYLYLSILFLLVACSKEDKLNTCGLVGEWLCCSSTSDCISSFPGQSIVEKWTFEEDGDYFLEYFPPGQGKWNTSEGCTELVIDPGTVDEYKVKIEINGDELIFKNNVFGDLTFCRQ